MTIEVGANVRTIAILVIIAALIIEWWSFRAKGRRP
jgi:hypothetical protein